MRQRESNSRSRIWLACGYRKCVCEEQDGTAGFYWSKFEKSKGILEKTSLQLAKLGYVLAAPECQRKCAFTLVKFKGVKAVLVLGNGRWTDWDLLRELGKWTDINYVEKSMTEKISVKGISKPIHCDCEDLPFAQRSPRR